MHRQLRVSDFAKSDMEDIWYWTAIRYDADQAVKYQALLDQALDDLRLDPERASSIPRPELGLGVRSYHIELSKFRSGTGIKSPRHVIVYALRRAGEVYILRIVHDRMDLRQQALE